MILLHLSSMRASQIFLLVGVACVGSAYDNAETCQSSIQEQVGEEKLALGV